jgi:Acetyltransferase (GNAT) domain
MDNQMPATDDQRLSRLSCFQLDPTTDVRWAEFVKRQPNASVFHSVGWLQALRHAYGYETLAYTTSTPTQELQNGLVFCRIQSRITGRRLVSLPFADHCDLLYDSAEDLVNLIRFSESVLHDHNLRYVEIRPTNGDFGVIGNPGSFQETSKYFLHTLSLTPSLDEIFRNFDKDCVQRRVRHGDRDGLFERCGRSEELLREFFALFVITRRRHHIPPAPLSWFRNLIQFLGEAVEIRVAYKDGIPVTAILTLRFNRTVYYKYGCSDARFNKLGAMPWLFWKAIVAAKSDGALEFDFGRTDEDNSGLLVFKNHFVPHPQPLVYWRYPKSSQIRSLEGRPLKTAKRLFSLMPPSVLRVIGQLAYRHIG